MKPEDAASRCAAIGAGTRLLALLGDPVAHSLSPRMQNAALAARSLDAVYLALRCDGAGLPGLLRGIAAAGGGGNVTVPHKSAAANLLDRPTDAVQATAACNAYWWEDGLLCGDNTDVAGVRAAVRGLCGSSAAGMRVLLLGAGGAAAAALHALLDDGAEGVTVMNRTPGRARALLEALPHAGRATVVEAGRVGSGEAFDLVVNATSLGLAPQDALPLDLEDRGAPRVGAALDLVYKPGRTAWVRHARRAGIPADDGREMLLHQGAAAFERWWSHDAPLDAMRAALADALGD